MNEGCCILHMVPWTVGANIIRPFGKSLLIVSGCRWSVPTNIVYLVVDFQDSFGCWFVMSRKNKRRYVLVYSIKNISSLSGGVEIQIHPLRSKNFFVVRLFQFTYAFRICVRDDVWRHMISWRTCFPIHCPLSDGLTAILVIT